MLAVTPDCHNTVAVARRREPLAGTAGDVMTPPRASRLGPVVESIALLESSQNQLVGPWCDTFELLQTTCPPSASVPGLAKKLFTRIDVTPREAPPETEPRCEPFATQPIAPAHLDPTAQGESTLEPPSLWLYCGEVCKKIGRVEPSVPVAPLSPPRDWPGPRARLRPLPWASHASQLSAAAVDSPCHRAVSLLSQLFSSVLVGPTPACTEPL